MLLVGRDLLWEKLGLSLVGRVMFNKTLIQLFADGWGCALSLLVVWTEVSPPWGLQALSVQFSSVTQSSPTLCDSMNRSMQGLPVHHQLLKFTQNSHPSSR